MPADKTFPDFVDPDSLTGAATLANSQKMWGSEMYGSILKFDSTGGRMTVFDDAGRLLTSVNGPYKSETYMRGTGGFQWAHYGMSHVLRHGGVPRCFCNVSAFDVDRWGRIFYPNTFQFEFCAMDNNRNRN